MMTPQAMGMKNGRTILKHQAASMIRMPMRMVASSAVATTSFLWITATSLSDCSARRRAAEAVVVIPPG